MKYRKSTSVVFLSMLCLVVVIAAVEASKASIGNVSKSDLAGAWQLSIVGQTGCGFGTQVYNFTLNSSGSSSSVSGTSHTSGCGDTSISGDTFSIQSLSSNGSGTANLTCGSGCGWNLTIQVAPERSSFSVVDVSSANPGNFIEGTAVHQ